MQEEKEKRLEELFESDLDNALESKYAPKEELPEEGTVAVAGKKTQETLTAADSIIEAFDIAEEELERIARNEVFLHYSYQTTTLITFSEKKIITVPCAWLPTSRKHFLLRRKKNE